MNYQNIYSFDLSNGTGVRMSLFVSGCKRRCPGCFNAQAWSFDSGKPFTGKEYFSIINFLKKNPYYQGLSVLGGEPFDQDEEGSKLLGELCNAVHAIGKDVWVWSGYTLEQLMADKRKRALLQHFDVLVDGPFEEDKKDLSLAFRGSSNQRIIHLKEVDFS